MAEDDDEDDPYGASAPSPPTPDSRQARPTQTPASDFQRGRGQQLRGALEMAKPSPPEQSGPSTEASHRGPESTAAPGTTEGPDPDAAVCSGRPFDSFMRVKNGSVFAFRGESHAAASSRVSRG